MRIPPPLIALGLAIIMGIVSQYISVLNFNVPFQFILSGLFFAGGILVNILAVRRFGHSKTTITPITPDKASALVTEGIYHYTRNPMYLGMLMFLIGWAISLGNPLNIAFIILFYQIINSTQIPAEEEALSKIFGVKFTDYCHRTRRWI